MTKTLTTEELRQIVETDHVQCGDAAAMARELLANREAQPVAPREQFESLCNQFWNWTEFDEINTEEEPRLKWDGKNYSHRVTAALWRMYQAAQPAPVVPDEKAITPFFDTIALDTAKMVMCDVNRRSDFLGGDIQLLARIQCRVDEACRAAMLAQPVTQGCNWIACGEQLPAVGETVLVSSDGYVSVGESERSGANYRYFTSVATGRELTVTHWMPLPAAPEGGSDPDTRR
ncbi:DUF551 domain-containing protein [Serratia liquefaciens]|uniref:DUF551 domain-containing protein n=1 Tax=Serratia liquefaciens TaxID=614 RepID=UPI003EC4AC00